MSPNSDKTQIRALIDTWARAARAKDMAGVLANHTEDIVMFDVPMPLAVQRDEAVQGDLEALL